MALDSLLQILEDKFQQNLTAFREHEEVRISEHEKALILQLNGEIDVYRDLRVRFVEDTFLKRKNELLMNERKTLDNLKEDCSQLILKEIKLRYQTKLETDSEFQDKIIRLLCEIVQNYRPFQTTVFESLVSKIEKLDLGLKIISSHKLLGFIAESESHKIEYSLQNMLDTRINDIRVLINQYMEMK